MPHKRIRITTTIFDTNVYRMDFWRKKVTNDKTRNRFLDDAIIHYCMFLEKCYPDSKQKMNDYIESVRWDNK